MSQPNAWYRAENARLRADLAKVLGKQYLFLNLRDLDGSWGEFQPLASASIHHTAEATRYTALDYFRAWLYDEVGEVLAEDYLNRAVPIDLNEVQNLLRLKGPIEIKRLIAAGWDPAEAWLSAMRQTVNAAQGMTHAYGQRNLQGLIGDHRHVLQGYRRIISPTACSFCRKLENTVWHPSAAWVKPHDKCGCTAEPVPNSAKVFRYLTPQDKANNQLLYERIKRRKDRENAALASLLQAAA